MSLFVLCFLLAYFDLYVSNSWNFHDISIINRDGLTILRSMIIMISWNTMFIVYEKKLFYKCFEDGKHYRLFYLENWWKVGIYLTCLNFPWYSRTWKIWDFVYWRVFLVKDKFNFVHRLNKIKVIKIYLNFI